MAVYYVASKLSFVACKTRCRSHKKAQKFIDARDKLECDINSKGELITMGFKISSDSQYEDFEDNNDFCNASNDIQRESVTHSSISVDFPPQLSYNTIFGETNGMILNCSLETLITMLIPQNSMKIEKGFVFSILLSSRIFIQPHDLLQKLIKSVPENDESLERVVDLIEEWTKRFPYDFRCEKIMSIVKHIVARSSANKQLSGRMSDILSALLAKLTDLSKHEEEMKMYKKSYPLLDLEPINWPSSSKLAQLLCHVEKKFAKHIGPEEFVQCSSSLIKQPSYYDVPNNANISSSRAEMKKKTCNLENYFEWSSRLRNLVANEILQCTNESQRTSKLELWTSVAQHCLLVGNYNSATSILEPIFRLQSLQKRFISLKNQQQINCLLNHIENSQNLNLWRKQTEKCCGTNIQTQNTSLPPTQLKQQEVLQEASITKVQPSHKTKSEWVVLPVFIDIVRLAVKAREDCSSRLPNGTINLSAFNELAAVVSAFTVHISNVPINPSKDTEEFNHLVNLIFTRQLTDENELFNKLEREQAKIEQYYDFP